ncbi:MAG: hypothetical protein HZB53_06075 [Chloroflexi bacterium]|nr:hypothetical protein [Chloroflexota bacterium]
MSERVNIDEYVVRNLLPCLTDRAYPRPLEIAQAMVRHDHDGAAAFLGRHISNFMLAVLDGTKREFSCYPAERSRSATPTR